MVTYFYRFASLHLWGQLPAQWQKAISRFYAGVYNKTFTRYIIKPYCKFNGLDSDYLSLFRSETGSETYSSFQDFFTRQYKIPPTITAPYVWPCEGFLCEYGRVASIPEVNVKGDRRHVKTVFGAYGQLLPDEYYFSNVFLHNNNYHRIHAPVNATIVEYERISGELVLLRPWIYRTDPSLPAMRNERVNVILKDEQERLWFLSIVGGPAVGTIILTSKFKKGRKLLAGDEIGKFLLGSTCCMAAPEPSKTPVGSSVCMGSLY